MVGWDGLGGFVTWRGDSVRRCRGNILVMATYHLWQHISYGVEIPFGDVVSISKIDNIAAVHDKQYKQPRDGCFESTLMIRMACRVDRKRIPGVRSLTPTPS